MKRPAFIVLMIAAVAWSLIASISPTLAKESSKDIVITEKNKMWMESTLFTHEDITEDDYGYFKMYIFSEDVAASMDQRTPAYLGKTVGWIIEQAKKNKAASSKQGNPVTSILKEKNKEVQQEKPVSNSHAWEVVGDPGFSLNEASHNAIYVYNDIPYVAFVDSGQGGKITVMKYDPKSELWEIVGKPGFSNEFGVNVSLFVSEGIPYVAYGYASLTVMKYDAKDLKWVIVGKPKISIGDAAYVSICIYNNTPFVTYRDGGEDLYPKVMKYNARKNIWEAADVPGFIRSTEYTYRGNMPQYLFYQKNGSLYVICQERNHGNIRIVKYNDVNGKFEAVSRPGFIPYMANWKSFKTEEKDLKVYKLMVEKYNFAKGGWVVVGGPVCSYKNYFSGEAPDGPVSCGVFKNSVYVMTDWKYDALFYEYNGVANTWEAIKVPQLSYYRSLFVDNGTPYIAYRDEENSSKLTVMRYK